ncbi:hypothetical protein [Nitratireductor sp. ZSWI3]|uniref:hypothetical protein n=1 Tax=Nitratireductor sp. ZSWI3 TaxID=2966359 RepID=UPI00215011A9|nr:hypothetical protein [Nitratireductor sp. ZSWI3]MCR4269078.1 hypothetical protein [Nitratireductor sp. ZSWI3]
MRNPLACALTALLPFVLLGCTHMQPMANTEAETTRTTSSGNSSYYTGSIVRAAPAPRAPAAGYRLTQQ